MLSLTRPLFRSPPKPKHIFNPLKPPTLTFLLSPSFPTTVITTLNAINGPSPPPLPSPRPRLENPSLSAAVSLIVGTAVGPGMLGLPSVTIRSGPLPSTLAIILSWLYVISSILIVAELSYKAMDEGALQEVSFTSLATNAFGVKFGSFVSLVYASLSFALVIACVSGIGSLVGQVFRNVDATVANAAFPCLVGIVIAFFPFRAIDTVNRGLCVVMVLSISSLVAVGLSVGRAHLLGSLKMASWSVSAMLPAIPVTVLTLGFHVITPFVCKIVGHSVYDARKAILIGGAIPLVMVLSWNLVILGLSNSGIAVSGDPIGVLLSVNPSALPAVQGFAFTALATSLIGYSVSFPKQLVDTIELMVKMVGGKRSQGRADDQQGGQVGFVGYHLKGEMGNSGKALFYKFKCEVEGQRDEAGMKQYDEYVEEGSGSEESKFSLRRNTIVMWVILFMAILVGTYQQAAFSIALDFAGIYANCFLFGILPPAMAWIHHSKLTERPSDRLLPGGNATLMLLFVIANLLMFWH